MGKRVESLMWFRERSIAGLGCVLSNLLGEGIAKEQ